MMTLLLAVKLLSLFVLQAALLMVLLLVLTPEIPSLVF